MKNKHMHSLKVQPNPTQEEASVCIGMQTFLYWSPRLPSDSPNIYCTTKMTLIRQCMHEILVYFAPINSKPKEKKQVEGEQEKLKPAESAPFMSH